MPDFVHLASDCWRRLCPFIFGRIGLIGRLPALQHPNVTVKPASSTSCCLVRRVDCAPDASRPMAYDQ